MSADSLYEFSSSFQILRDSPKNIDFHIRSGDYFAFLATMLGVLEDAIANAETDDELKAAMRIARELRNDLRYVQANYTVDERPLGDIQVIRPKGDLMARRKLGSA